MPSFNRVPRVSVPTLSPEDLEKHSQLFGDLLALVDHYARPFSSEDPEFDFRAEERVAPQLAENNVCYDTERAKFLQLPSSEVAELSLVALFVKKGV